MKKWKERWNGMLLYEKVFEVTSYVIFSLFLGVAFYELFFTIGVQGGVLERILDAEILITGLLAVAVGCQAVVHWRRKRSSGIWNLAFAIMWGLDAVWKIVKLLIG